jgi:DNA-binding beta-propeller fold protein YncE
LRFTGLRDVEVVAVDSVGAVYVTDFNNNRVLKLPPG